MGPTASKWLFFIFLAIILSALALVIKNKKRYLLFLMVFFAPFRTGIIFFHWNGIMLMDFPLFMLVLWGLFENRRFRLYFPRVGPPIIGLLAWSLLSAFFAVRVDWAISEWTRVFRGFLALACVAHFVQTRKDLAIVVSGLIAGFFAQSLIGILQWRFGYLGLWMLDETLHGRWRSQGTFPHPVVFSTYLAFMLPWIFRLFIFSRDMAYKTRILYGFLVLMGIVAVFTTRGRGAMLSIFIAVSFMFIASVPRKKLRPRVYWPIILTSLFMVAFSARYGDRIVDRFQKATSEEDNSASLRMPLNRIAIRVIKAHPIFGTGMDNYLLVASDFIIPEGKFNYSHLYQEVHNVYLLIAAEAGVPALVFYLWFIAAIIHLGRRGIKSRNSHLANLSAGITFSYVAILVAFLGTPDYRIHQILILFWLVAGILLAINKLNARMEVMLRRRGTENVKRNDRTARSQPA